MKSLKEILEADDQVYEIFTEVAPKMAEFMHTSTIPKTAQALFHFIAKTNAIKEAIFNSCEGNNLYAINILYRSLVEHLLRFHYIFFRVLIDKTDEIGQDYLKFCSLSENIDYGIAWKDVAKILERNPEADPYEVLKEIDEDYKDYTKAQIQEKSNQFRYKQIVRYIKKQLNDQTDTTNSFLLNIIPEYASLSSYVHGGPQADWEMFKYSDEDLEAFVLERTALTLNIATTVKMFTLLVYCQYDPSFGPAYTKMNKAINLIQ